MLAHRAHLRPFMPKPAKATRIIDNLLRIYLEAEDIGAFWKNCGFSAAIL
jgi:hypothetical protein